MLNDFRGSYIKTETPAEIEPGKDPRFSLAFMGDPKSETNREGMKALLVQARAIAKEKWGIDPYMVRQKAVQLGFGKKLEGDEDGIKFNAFFNGNIKKAKNPEYEGLWILTAHNTVKDYLKTKNNTSLTDAQRATALARLEGDYRPLIAGRSGKVVEPGDKQYPYSGCYLRGKVYLWTSEHEKGGRQIIASIRSLQFLRPGEAFGRGAIDAEKEFEKLEDDEDAAEAFDDASASHDFD